MKEYSAYPTPTYKWGAIELVGSDGTIVHSQVQRWYRTRKEASTYGEETFGSFILCNAFFGKQKKSTWSELDRYVIK